MISDGSHDEQYNGRRFGEAFILFELTEAVAYVHDQSRRAPPERWIYDGRIIVTNFMGHRKDMVMLLLRSVRTTH